MNFPIFSQKDPKWADKKINNTNSTFKDYGCAISSLAMLCLYWGKETNPAKLHDELIKVGGFQDDMVKWEMISGIYPDIIYKETVNCDKTAAPLEKLNENLPCILKVKIGKQDHFIVAWEKQGNDYFISDPFYGDQLLLTTRYKPIPARTICGLRIFEHQISSIFTKEEIKKKIIELVNQL